jgi:TPR repeat protein
VTANEDPPDSAVWPCVLDEIVVEAALECASRAYGAGEHDVGDRAVRLAADAGQLSAMRILAHIYAHDDPLDLVLAERWFRRAAEAGDVTSMTNEGTAILQALAEAQNLESVSVLAYFARELGGIPGLVVTEVDDDDDGYDRIYSR